LNILYFYFKIIGHYLEFLEVQRPYIAIVGYQLSPRCFVQTLYIKSFCDVRPHNSSISNEHEIVFFFAKINEDTLSRFHADDATLEQKLDELNTKSFL
jgi:hypothetical protein